ncbi:hypothetical protein NFI96_026246 [Prochilodus magdalenae]|nr:hypothetical protein NFI96_026246 [Prochilodus magdalenae]
MDYSLDLYNYRELLHGRTLYSIVRDTKNTLDINKTRQIAQEIVKGMGYLHAKGIVHKDLKSKNVFHDTNKVVITDFGLFGISGVVQEGRRENELRLPHGWICYLAPEIVRKMSPGNNEDRLPFSNAADVYAFGTIWYELQARDWPITNQPVEATIWQVGSGEGIKKVLAEISLGKEVSEILSACWSYDSRDRPTFTQLADMLEKLPKLNRRLSHPGHFWKSAEYILPFTGLIQGGLCEGKIITVTGRVLAGSERFHVNFQCGTTGSPDVAFHFNPRYGWGSAVVCNTRQNSSWGTEEWNFHMPLSRGSNFVLTFLVNRDSYTVRVNDVHFLEYLHRLPISRVKAISVEGGVEIESIAFQNPVTSCVQQPGVKQQGKRGRSKGSACRSHHMQNQQHAGLFQAPPPYSSPYSPPYSSPYSPPQTYCMPYKAIIQGGLYPGKTIIVQGLVNYDADRFCINLRFNSGLAFHFNPRFSENVVVRNSLLQDRWGPEERAGGMPFYRGQPFTVTIVCDTRCYKILINGVQMFTYNHRHFLFQQIDILEVEGNVSLSFVSV